MGPLRRQYLVLFAIEGSVLPFIPVYLADQQGLTDGQIGTVLAAGSAALLVTPLLLTALADARIPTRALLAGALLLTAAGIGTLGALSGYVPAVLAFGLYGLAFEPCKPLLHGLFFSLQHETDASGVGFHQVRVWGTVGYILPSVLLYLALDGGASLGVLPWLTVAVCLVGAAGARALPQPGQTLPVAPLGGEGGDPDGSPWGSRRATLLRAGAALREAARVLGQGPVRRLWLGMFAMQVTVAAWGAFFPLHLTRVVGVEARWVGLVTNVGVVVEVGYMLGFGWLVHRLGWRRLMTGGALGQALRLGLLAVSPTLAVALGTQLLHGFVVIVTLVGSRVLINDAAPEPARHTTQGLYTMSVLGGGRVVGSLAAGAIAGTGLPVLFTASAALALVAAGLLWSSTTAPS